VALDLEGAAADLSVGPGDFAAPSDFSIGGDLAGRDLAVGGDLSVANDLSVPADLAGADLAGRDLATPPDLSVPHDLATPPDLVQSGDLSLPSFAGPVTDFDVAGDGSIFEMYSDGTTVSGHCFAPDGSVRATTFTIYTGAVSTINFPRVQTARTAGISLVTWAVYSASTWQIMSRLYNASCAPITAAFNWPGGANSQYTFDAAIDGSGNSYLLWTSPLNVADAGVGSTTYLSYYNASGVKSSSGDQVVDQTGRCGNDYGMHVAVNAAGTYGVVTCQQHEDQPVRYRRFFPNTSAFADPALVDVTEATMTHSSWYESHQAGIADDGSFVIEWQDATNRSFRANFYNAASTSHTNVTLGPTSAQYYDGFRGFRASVEITGGNYVLRDGFQGQQFWTYSTAGVLLGCDRAATLPMRTGGSTKNWIASGGKVVEGAMDFTRFNLCAPPTCGNGIVEAHEQCDDGNREPYDGCNEFCRSEICGDGVVTNKEQCDDGPTGSALCDATCHFKTQSPPVGTNTITGVGDFDVASDGTLVTTQLDAPSGILYATCYAPNHTLIRERFPIAPQEWQVSYPTVVTSRVSKKSLVGWASAGNNIGVKLLDSSCLMVAPHASLSGGSEFYDTAIDDTGRSVVATTTSAGANGVIAMAFYDANGALIKSFIESTGTSAVYGIHVAMNQTAGGGVLSFQAYSGAVVYYQRFTSAGGFTDLAPINATAVSYVAWYDGHTVGMNDAGQFVIEWRDTNGYVNAAFYSTSTPPTQVGTAIVSMRVRTSEGNQIYDSFRRRHEKIPLQGTNFIFGETYNWYVTSTSGGTDAAGDTSQNWFIYTPTGAYANVSYLNTYGVDSGLNARLDGNNVSYFLQQGIIYFGAGEL
jgi:cysteine-rich repeat protein